MKREQEVMLAMQQALLGEVFVNLRAVSIEFTESQICFFCYLYQEPSLEDKESIECISTEISASFPESHDVSYRIIAPTDKSAIEWHGAAVFARRPDASQKIVEY